MTVRMYASTDQGAPTLTAEPGSLVNLLKKCLMDGYDTGGGAKPGLGWDFQVSTDGNFCLFRSAHAQASGVWTWVDNSIVGPVGNGKRAARCQWVETLIGFDTATGAVSGVRQWPTDPVSDHANYIGLSYDYDTAALFWCVIGDERAMYLFTQQTPGAVLGQSGTEGYAGHFFGELKGVCPTLTKPFLAVTTSLNGDEVQLDGLAETAIVRSHNRCAQDITGAANATSGMISYWLNPLGVTWSALGRAAGGTPIPYPNSGWNGLFVSPLAYSMAGSNLAGFMPGLYAPLHNRPLGDLPLAVSWDVGELAGRSLEYLPLFNYSGGGACLVDLTGDWYG